MPRSEPTYRRLAEELRNKIVEREFASNGRLPTEAELVKQYETSRHTVRRAYLELEAQGLVYRTPGRGSFAVPPISSSDQYVRSFGAVEDLLALSADTTTQVLEPLRPTPANELVDLFDCHRDASVYRASVLRLYQDAPFSTTSVAFPDWVGEQLVKSDRTPLNDPSATFLAEVDTIVEGGIAAAYQEIRAVTCSDATAEILEVESGYPALEIVRRYSDYTGRIVELAISMYRGDRYTHRQELRRSHPQR